MNWRQLWQRYLRNKLTGMVYVITGDHGALYRYHDWFMPKSTELVPTNDNTKLR